MVPAKIFLEKDNFNPLSAVNVLLLFAHKKRIQHKVTILKYT